MSVYPFIEAEKAGSRNVKRACELLRVSRAAFYQHLTGPSRRVRGDAELAAEITAVQAGSRGRYGSPRVHAQLARDGRRHGTGRAPIPTRAYVSRRIFSSRSGGLRTHRIDFTPYDCRIWRAR